MTATYDIYRKLSAKPLGTTAFNLAYSFKAPYFGSVRPRVLAMAPHHGEVLIKKRRAVQNHLGTVHAIAVANGLEAAMGLLCEATVPAGMRWIPKGIQLDYLAKVPTDIRCVARTQEADWSQEPPFQLDVECSAYVTDGTKVVRGVIPVWVTRAR